MLSNLFEGYLKTVSIKMRLLKCFRLLNKRFMIHFYQCVILNLPSFQNLVWLDSF